MNRGISGMGDTPRILIVEPNSEKALLYARWLGNGYAIDIARDCTSAYKLFDKEIDVALISRQLPDSSGDELLNEIREFDLDWRVALLTDSLPPLDIVNLDISEYLCRPITETELCNTTDRLVAQAKFGTALTEFYTLVQKRQLLETHHSDSELSDNDAYTEIQSQLTTLRNELAGMIEAFRTAGGHNGIAPGLVEE